MVKSYTRLACTSRPATVLHARTEKGKASVEIAREATQNFITTMDVVKLDQRSVDEIQCVC